MNLRRLPSRALAWSWLLALAALTACDSYRVRELPSQNQDGRVRYLILHYTTENTADSLRLLTEPSSAPVSAHYVVDVPPANRPRAQPTVFQLVPESARAWHAGRSFWSGETALNASSIGIEIVNESNCLPLAAENPSAPCRFAPYPPGQIDAVVRLCREILARHPDIEPWRVLGHSDVAPARKVDPGPLFPWRQLHEAGVGAWPDEVAVQRFTLAFAERLPSLMQVQEALAAWGYDVATSGVKDKATRDAVSAFQLHFRPERHDGVVDVGTVAR
ncbi:MAG: N-acetylmuramoyl-L-alanine amidase, partial [Pseudomonadota bacterium]